MSTPEQRFFEGAGKRFMPDGITVRCQAVSKHKSKLRGNDYDNDWPENQCAYPATLGNYVCKYHGGATSTESAYFTTTPISYSTISTYGEEHSYFYDGDLSSHTEKTFDFGLYIRCPYCGIRQEVTSPAHCQCCGGDLLTKEVY